MRKLTLLLLFMFALNTSNAQEIYFLTGKNFTQYKVTYNGTETVNALDKKGVGDSYEMGYAFRIGAQKLAFDNNLDYRVGITLNQYNAVGGDNINNFTWNTEYIGIQNSIKYSFIDRDRLDLSLKLGVNAATMIYGTQLLNNSRLDLKNAKDFTGVVVSPSAGLEAKCNLSEYGYLSIGYNYFKSFNLTNNTEKKTSFLTHQIVFGISFEVF